MYCNVNKQHKNQKAQSVKTITTLTTCIEGVLQHFPGEVKWQLKQKFKKVNISPEASLT